MDGERFDEVICRVATRRAALRGIGGGAVVALLTIQTHGATSAKRRHKHHACLPNGTVYPPGHGGRCCEGYFGDACSRRCGTVADCNPGQTCVNVYGTINFCANP